MAANKRPFEDLIKDFDPPSNTIFLNNMIFYKIAGEKNGYPFLSYEHLDDYAKNSGPLEVDPAGLFRRILGLRMKYLAALKNPGNLSSEEQQVFNLSEQVFNLTGTMWDSDSSENTANCPGEMEILDRMFKFYYKKKSHATDDYATWCEFFQYLPGCLDFIAVANKILNLQRNTLVSLKSKDGNQGNGYKRYYEIRISKKSQKIWGRVVADSSTGPTSSSTGQDIMKSSGVSENLDQPDAPVKDDDITFLKLMIAYHKKQGEYPFAEGFHLFNFTFFCVPRDSTVKEVKERIASLRQNHINTQQKLPKKPRLNQLCNQDLQYYWANKINWGEYDGTEKKPDYSAWFKIDGDMI